jgi:DNA polymerase delta subunit 2
MFQCNHKSSLCNHNSFLCNYPNGNRSLSFPIVTEAGNLHSNSRLFLFLVCIASLRLLLASLALVAASSLSSSLIDHLLELSLKSRTFSLSLSPLPFWIVASAPVIKLVYSTRTKSTYSLFHKTQAQTTISPTMTLSVQSPPQQRAFCAHQPKWQRFQTSLLVVSKQSAVATAAATSASSKKQAVVDVHPYQRQYAHVYHERLEALGPRCWEAIPTTTGEGDPSVISRVDRILELLEGVVSAAVGTIVKEHSVQDKNVLHADSKCCASDALFLEDASGRVALEFDTDSKSSDTDHVHAYCTGMVVGVVGCVRADGVLVIHSVHYPVAAPSFDDDNNNSSSTTATAANTTAPHVLFLSGLQCGGVSVSSLPRELLVAYLEGRFGVDAARVSRIVIAGGSCAAADKNSSMSASVKELDAFLLQVAATGIPIDIMPGQDDPASANWPQRPLHRSLLKQTDRYCSNMVNRTPNPYSAVYGSGKQQLVVGTDGANVQDLSRSLLLTTTNDNDAMDVEDSKTAAASTSTFQTLSELQALERTFTAGHICPTGPDSVPTIPHPTQDPMVLTVTPDVYFSGNCSKFATKTVTTVQSQPKKRLLCLPKFGETGEAVLVNMETLGVELLCFEE